MEHFKGQFSQYLHADLQNKTLVKLDMMLAPWELVGTPVRVGRDFFELEDQNGEITTHNIADIMYYREA